VSKLNWEKRNKAEAPKVIKRNVHRGKVIQGYANGAKNEQARIIKLFSKHYGDFDLSNNMVDVMTEQEFIGLITKGKG